MLLVRERQHTLSALLLISFVAAACDIIRSQDIPSGIRQTLISVPIPQTELDRSFQNLQAPCSDPGTLSDDDGTTFGSRLVHPSRSVAQEHKAKMK